jgi:hypothetical protein
VPRMNILNTVEQEAFESAPVFNSFQRKHYFDFPQATRREALLDAVAHGSAVAWRHLNLLGEYDFSEEKLRDSVGIRLPKLTP